MGQGEGGGVGHGRLKVPPIACMHPLGPPGMTL